jgi:hypothetical protein
VLNAVDRGIKRHVDIGSRFQSPDGEKRVLNKKVRSSPSTVAVFQSPDGEKRVLNEKVEAAKSADA